MPVLLKHVLFSSTSAESLRKTREFLAGTDFAASTIDEEIHLQVELFELPTTFSERRRATREDPFIVDQISAAGVFFATFDQNDDRFNSEDDLFPLLIPWSNIISVFVGKPKEYPADREE